MSPPTEREIIEAASRTSSLGQVVIKGFLNTLAQVPFETRLDILQRLHEQQIPSKSDSIICKFIADHSHTTTKLRSGRKWLHLRKGEHRALTVGEELPFEFVVDGAMREGGTAKVRRVRIANSDFALKSFAPETEEIKIRKELGIMRNLSHNHVCSLFASVVDTKKRIHLLIEPWGAVLPATESRLSWL
jgi:hypothetical protein